MNTSSQPRITGAQLLIQELERHNVQQIFGIPGESYLAALDALYDSKQIEYIVCRQEGGAAMAADGYGKLTGQPGICMVTRGPGATNASAGVHVAFQDSTPMILFIGQVGRSMIEREAFQEIDYRRMYGQMAKWVTQIDDASRIPEYISRAFHTATSGRPGPVVIALPEDMLCDLVEPFNKVQTYMPADSAPSPQALADIHEHLKTCSRPLMIVGGGGWSAQTGADIIAFAQANGIPVASSFRCQDYVDNRHSHYCGHVAIGIDANLATRIEAADIILVVGSRLGEMTSNNYSLFDIPVPKQKLIHIHPSAEEIGRVYQPVIGISCPLSQAAQALASLPPVPSDHRQVWLETARSEFEAFQKTTKNPGTLQMSEVIADLSRRLPDNAIVTNGAGNYAIWLHRFYTYREYRTQLAPTSGSMGYGLPAAVAGAATYRDRDVVCITGDGDFMMSCQELATAVHYQLNLKVIIVNNGMYGTIRMHQERTYSGRVFGTDIVNPDFVDMAKNFGARGERVEVTEDFMPALERALKHEGPAVIELLIDREALTPNATLSEISAG